MVHRHTEYKMKYYVPNEENTKKMWLENIKFRESRRAMNLADHYWDFQVTNDAFCCEDCLTAPSKCNGKEAANENKQNDPEATPPERKENDSNKGVASSYREASVQTPKWVQHRPRDAADLKKVPHFKKNSKSLESVRDAIEGKNSKVMPVKKSKQCKSSPPASGATLRYSALRETKNFQDVHDLQGPFFPYGWNDDNKNVGDMKTFNVLAPPREVHPPAIMAMRRRKEQVRKCTMSKSDKKQKSVSLISIPKINHSSIWTTEYKEKFSKNPMTAR